MAEKENMLSHVDAAGRATMVDVAEKSPTRRRARAEGFVVMKPATLAMIHAGKVPKGEVLNTARVAGIMAAKNTGSLIPLCHPLPVEHISVDFEALGDGRLRIESTASIFAKTGVEMEALVAATVAALTIYDMIKAVDRDARITDIHVLEKTGGKSGAETALPPKPGRGRLAS